MMSTVLKVLSFSKEMVIHWGYELDPYVRVQHLFVAASGFVKKLLSRNPAGQFW